MNAEKLLTRSDDRKGPHGTPASRPGRPPEKAQADQEPERRPQGAALVAGAGGPLDHQTCGDDGILSRDPRLDGVLAELEHSGPADRPLRPLPGVRAVAVHLQHDPDLPDAADHGRAEPAGPGCRRESGGGLRGQRARRGGDRDDPEASGESERADAPDPEEAGEGGVTGTGLRPGAPPLASRWERRYAAIPPSGARRWTSSASAFSAAPSTS